MTNDTPITIRRHLQDSPWGPRSGFVLEWGEYRQAVVWLGRLDLPKHKQERAINMLLVRAWMDTRLFLGEDYYG